MNKYSHSVRTTHKLINLLTGETYDSSSDIEGLTGDQAVNRFYTIINQQIQLGLQAQPEDKGEVLLTREGSPYRIVVKVEIVQPEIKFAK